MCFFHLLSSRQDLFCVFVSLHTRLVVFLCGVRLQLAIYWVIRNDVGHSIIMSSPSRWNRLKNRWKLISTYRNNISIQRRTKPQQQQQKMRVYNDDVIGTLKKDWNVTVSINTCQSYDNNKLDKDISLYSLWHWNLILSHLWSSRCDKIQVN